jgi:hypothetical protein
MGLNFVTLQANDDIVARDDLCIASNGCLAALPDCSGAREKHDRPVMEIKTIRIAGGNQMMPDASPASVNIDVEGHEVDVLKGMEQVFQRSRPGVLALLDRLGYGLETVEAPEPGVNNYAAVPWS